MNPWLLLDVSNLAYRAFFSMPRLTHGDILTSVVYGVLRDVVDLQRRFCTDNVAWCFDFGQSLRYTKLPQYKSTREKARKELPTDQQHLRVELNHQIHLMMDYLIDIGYRNVFFQEGYEADDIIASICYENMEPDDANRAIIVSEDNDLYQLLSNKISMWLPRRQQMMTAQRFRNIWGISPSLWSYAKSIAGCSSDDIPGVKGVGEKTACKYIRGELLSEGNRRWHAIQEAIESGQVQRNMEIVELPYARTKTVTLRDNKVTVKKWKRFCDRLMLRSLRNHPPIRR